MQRPKGYPRKQWESLSNKQRSRFLDFNTNVHTTQVNSGSQSYGMGNKSTTRSARQMPKSLAGGMVRQLAGKPRPHARGTVIDAPQRHRELVSDVTTSVGFEATQYRLQPADATTFPWLSTIAEKYQKWRIHSLKFEFVPTVGEFATAGQQGRVVLAFNYDPLDAILETIQQAEALEPKAVGLPTERRSVAVSPKLATPVPLLVRNGLVQTGQSLSAYDAGVLYVCTNGADAGVASGTKIGELFVDYTIELLQPILVPIYKSPPATHSTRLISDMSVTTTIPVTGSLENLPGLEVDSEWNGCGITIDATSGGYLFQPGRYLVTGRAFWNVSNIIGHKTGFSVAAALDLYSTMDWDYGSAGGSVISKLNSAQAVWWAMFHFTAPTVVIPMAGATGSGTLNPGSTYGWPRLLCQTV